VLSHNPVQPCMDPAAAVLLGSLSFDFVILPLRRRGLGLLLLVVFFLATSACPSSALCHFLACGFFDFVCAVDESLQVKPGLILELPD
jgi:hypothetical protein